jgi:uncharacterized protein (TIGR03437 family)
MALAVWSLMALGSFDTALGQGTTVTVNPSVLNFTVAPGNLIQAQSVNVGSSGGSVVVVPSLSPSGSWLTISPATAFQAPTSLQVGVNASSLPTGNYQGTVTLSPSGGGTPATITVNLTVNSGTSQLTVNPTTLTFNTAPGSGLLPSQTFTVSSPVVTNFNVSTSGGAWLQATPLTGNTGSASTVTVSANATGLATGVYSGTVNVTSPQGDATVAVTLNVGTSGSGLSTSPATLTFNSQIGGGTPTPQTITVSAVTPVNFTATPTTQTGGNWLLVSPGGGNTQTANTLSVSVNPAGLAAGTYNGSIQLQSAAGNATVSVTLNVSANPTLQVSPAGPLSFFYQTGGSLPPTQLVNLTSTGSSLAFNVGITTQSCGSGWLVVSPFSGATGASGATLSVSINPAGLVPANCQGTITIQAPGAANPTTTITVNLLVSNNPLITASPNSLTFNGSVGGTAPPGQTLTIGSTGTPLVFFVSATVSTTQQWLSVTPNQGSTTAGQVTVNVNPAGLPAGDYTGTVTITSAGAANSPITIPVTLRLTNTVQINATPASLYFVFQTGQTAPNQQVIQITSTGQALPVQVAAATSSCGANWLAAGSPNQQTPASVFVGVNPAGITPQTCTGTVTITAQGAANSPLQIPVVFVVSNTPLLNVSPTSFNITVQQGQNAQTQAISLTSTDPVQQLQFQAIAATSSGGLWLLVGPNTGTTPGNLVVQFQTAGLAAGSYEGTITITSPGLPQPLTIPVRLTVTSLSNLALSPGSLTFSLPQGGSNPPGQPVSVTASQGTLNFSATAQTNFGGNWLSVTPANGVTPGTLTVNVNAAGLVQGSYTGSITVVAPGAGNSPQTIPVTLNVGAPQTLTVSPTTLAFNFTQGSANPPAQPLTLNSTGGAVNFSIDTLTTNGGAWLSATPTSGSTVGGVAQVNVSVNPAPGGNPLAPGSYSGQVRVNSPVLQQAIVVNVTFTIQAPVAPAPATLVNAASSQPGAISPGQIITIKGVNIGPPNPQTYRLNAQGGLDPLLGGVRVLFDGFPGSPIYVSSTQINVIVPYEIAGRTQTTVEVEYNGVRGRFTSPFAVTPTSPGIFTLSATGAGQGSIVNFDNGVINGPVGSVPGIVTAPAQRGRYVLIYITGGGQTNPPNTTGAVPTNARTLLAPVTVDIGGVTVTPDYAGASPFQVAGLEQLNVRIPDNAPTGPAIRVTVNVGGVVSPATVTMAIQ